MKAYWGLDLLICVLLILALAGGEWSASRSCRFNPGERAPGTYCIGGWSRSGRCGEVTILDPTGTQTPALLRYRAHRLHLHIKNINKGNPKNFLSRKTENSAVGIRHADRVAPSIHKSWH
jgi:hypothetical protein